MKLKAFEADYSCGHFAPKNFKIGSVVKKLSPKNRGVAVKAGSPGVVTSFPKKSGIFKRRELCAYLELGKVFGHYEIVLLEICRLPRFFL